MRAKNPNMKIGVAQILPLSASFLCEVLPHADYNGIQTLQDVVIAIAVLWP